MSLYFIETRLDQAFFFYSKGADKVIRISVLASLYEFSNYLYMTAELLLPALGDFFIFDFQASELSNWVTRK